MGLFETYPWLLIPIIIITVEAWQALKELAREAYSRRKEPAAVRDDGPLSR
jgi:hypothetical protein